MKRQLIRDAGGLPPWFPLAVYSNELSPTQWLEELSARIAVQEMYRERPNKAGGIVVFNRGIVDRTQRPPVEELFKAVELRELLGVRDLPVYDAAYMGSRLITRKKGKALMEAITRQRFSNSPGGLVDRQYRSMRRSKSQAFIELIHDKAERHPMSSMVAGIPVAVDISQDDESLIWAFQVWLSGVRQVAGGRRRRIGSNDFADWKRYGVLQVFDLTFWGEVNNIRYSETLVADQLWPDDDIHRTDRLRKVTRIKMAEIFDGWHFVHRLWKQLLLDRAIDEAAAEYTDDA